MLAPCWRIQFVFQKNSLKMRTLPSVGSLKHNLPLVSLELGEQNQLSNFHKPMWKNHKMQKTTQICSIMIFAGEDNLLPLISRQSFYQVQ